MRRRDIIAGLPSLLAYACGCGGDAAAVRDAQKESIGPRSLGKTPYERVRDTDRHQEAREP